MKIDLQQSRQWLRTAFPVLAVVVVFGFLLVSDRLVNDLAEQERARMQIWADATREIVNMSIMPEDGVDEMPAPNFDFLLSIIEGNRTIPVLLTDDDGTIINHRNFSLPEPVDTLNPLYISPANQAYLEKRLARLKKSPNVIHISISPGFNQHLYYEDSRLLKSLSIYPYALLGVMIAFVIAVYFAVVSSKKAEQNKVWVGLSKETAHQLGTPISSLMAWIELLPGMGVDEEVVGEMDKDVTRLATIASRFSKIGSLPKMEEADLNNLVGRATGYMRSRISQNIALSDTLSPETLTVNASAPLIEWVIENLVKNAVDAMEGHGSIKVATRLQGNKAVIEVTDSGKGIPRNKFKTIFKPGFTTKKRGWGLGLTLAKRIVEQYHHGTIAVVGSEPGVATTFRITLPIEKNLKNG